MRKIAGLVSLMVIMAVLVGCQSAGPAPANYYENDIHHGYPGPGVTDPSAV
jgi:hypothetical protein